MSQSGQKRTRVPVFFGAIFLICANSCDAAKPIVLVEMAGDAVEERELPRVTVAVDFGDQSASTAH